MRRRLHLLPAVLACVLLSACGSRVVLSGETAAGGAGLNDLSGIPEVSAGGGADPSPTSTAASQSSVGSGAAGDPSNETVVPGETSGGSSGASSGPTASAARIPLTGRGWDEKKVYLGTAYQQAGGAIAAGGALGVKVSGFIDQKEVVSAVLKDVNANGGLFGRGVSAVFAEFPPLTGSGESQCARWTQDNKVVAVTDTFYDKDEEYGCLAKAKVPFAASAIAATDDRLLQQYGPYMMHLNVMTSSRLFPLWIKRLTALNYFAKWNTLTGGPGTTAVKTGLLCRDDYPSTRRDCGLLTTLLTQAGYKPQVSHISGSDQGQAAVLAFKAAGVTHVFSETTDIAFFASNAEQQKYRPRYAISTLSALTVLLSKNAPAAQLVGSLGVGWLPGFDVITPPPLGKAQKHCRDVLAKQQIKYEDPIQYNQAQAICDGIYLFVNAAKLGGGLSSEAILSGMSRINTVYESANTFESAFSATRHDEVGAVRDLGWNVDCKCFKYLSTTNHRG